MQCNPAFIRNDLTRSFNSKSLVTFMCEYSDGLFKWSGEVNWELLLVRADQGILWQFQVITVWGKGLWHSENQLKSSWCDSQSILWSCMCKMQLQRMLWSCMCKMVLWLSIITLLMQQYCVCYQIWHKNTTMCNMKQWALKWGRQKIITYTFLLLMAHILNFFSLMISCKVHVQSSCSRKNLLNTLAPKTACRRVQ